jgi:hypothetical protein
MTVIGSQETTKNPHRSIHDWTKHSTNSQNLKNIHNLHVLTVGFRLRSQNSQSSANLPIIASKSEVIATLPISSDRRALHMVNHLLSTKIDQVPNRVWGWGLNLNPTHTALCMILDFCACRECGKLAKFVEFYTDDYLPNT